MTNGFTKTQQRIVDLLSDGLPHTRQELHACLPDELTALAGIQAHICNIRKQLRPRGQDIVCEIYNRSVHYRHVILLSPSSLD